VPDGHHSVYVFLPYRLRHRDAMVPIPDKVDAPNPDQFYRWQRHGHLARYGNAQPAILIMRLEWVESAIKVFAATLTATNPGNRYGLCPSVLATTHGMGGLDRIQVKQAARASGYR
jgi:hypothetical protein